ncbi:hypothetical protein B0T21DRAFT_347699 [Apiosordaria backusii]|uniref:Uncharacterized protein n=1 Tax=Apiosordaria backusii TaxID=314023 RepID=A0AA40BN60_9PEZI|nr:hypothetical protein B0T21DRAFT_347699 [Apiosordaria backusii]
MYVEPGLVGQVSNLCRYRYEVLISRDAKSVAEVVVRDVGWPPTAGSCPIRRIAPSILSRIRTYSPEPKLRLGHQLSIRKPPDLASQAPAKSITEERNADCLFPYLAIFVAIFPNFVSGTACLTRDLFLTWQSQEAPFGGSIFRERAVFRIWEMEEGAQDVDVVTANPLWEVAHGLTLVHVGCICAGAASLVVGNDGMWIPKRCVITPEAGVTVRGGSGKSLRWAVLDGSGLKCK